MTADEVNEFTRDTQRLLYELVRNYEQCDKMCLGQFGVTASQAYTILAFPADVAINMNRLSEIMGLAGSTMTRMVDQLVEKGFVQRRPGDEDRREVLVRLTEKGRRTREDLQKAQREAIGAVLGDVAEEERSSIVAVLTRLNSALQKATKVCCR